MRVLVIYAHPVESSYAASLHVTVLEALQGRHEVRDIDLYAENFDPRLSRAERLDYHDAAANRDGIARYVEALRWAEAVVFCFPVFCGRGARVTYLVCYHMDISTDTSRSAFRNRVAVQIGRL